MKKGKTVKSVTGKKGSKMKLMPNTVKEVRMLRSSKTVKHAMELLDDTFSYLKQKPPTMKAYMDDPSAAFLIETYALVSKWPESVLSQFITDLTNLEPKRGDVSGMIGTVKRIIHEVFGDTDRGTGETYLARWRMWPHRRSKVEDEVVQRVKDPEENLMKSKLATKKKVTSIKAPATSKVKAPKGGKIKDDTKLRVIKGSKRPKNDERARVKGLISGTMTAAAIMKKTGCKLKTLEVMLNHDYVEIV